MVIQFKHALSVEVRLKIKKKCIIFLPIRIEKCTSYDHINESRDLVNASRGPKRASCDWIVLNSRQF